MLEAPVAVLACRRLWWGRLRAGYSQYLGFLRLARMAKRSLAARSSMPMVRKSSMIKSSS